jgi:hypothetical protein
MLFVVVACFFSLLHLIFFSSLTPSSYQSNNISFMATFEQERASQDKQYYMRVCESDSFFFSFSKFDASVVFFFLSFFFISYICLLRQATYTQIASFDLFLSVFRCKRKKKKKR